MKRLRRVALALPFASLFLIHCGAREELYVGPQLPLAPECYRDSDCPGFDDPCNPSRCISPSSYPGDLPETTGDGPLPLRVCIADAAVECDDDDPCTDDACDPISGSCTYVSRTLDLDGDGYFGPLPGTTAGSSDACGGDCDDSSPAAFPGATEICDGVDNDCNGIVDDGANYSPLQTAPTRISGDIAPSGPGGLAFNGLSYLAIYTGTQGGFDMYQTGIDESGAKIEPLEQQVTAKSADSSGGPLVWVGDRYGLAWQDRRDGNYEVYFTLLNESGERVIPDLRVSNGLDFSVNVDLVYNGKEFVVAWQDRRSGIFEVLAHRISVDGELVGEETSLSSPGGFDDESPALASGTATLGLAYANGQAGFQVLRFRTFEQTSLNPASSVVTISDSNSESVYPKVIWNQDRYIVTWYVRGGGAKAIYGTSLAEDGTVLTPPTRLSEPGQNRSRFPELLPLGDRSLLIYADDRDANQGYELYTRMLAADLSPLGPEQRLTNAPFDSIYPTATFGPNGDVGVLFRDDRDGGNHHVWFTRLGCVAQP